MKNYFRIVGLSLLITMGLSFTSQAQTKPTDTELLLLEAIRKGATMEEIAKLKEPAIKTPDEALRALKIGNSRFFGGQARRPEQSANERRAQILGQSPFAAIISCSDSRVPTEIVYDQNLGDLFVSRVAGNIIDPATVGSIEYAVTHLKSQIVVVMGHEGCGAVKAALLTNEELAGEPDNVKYLIGKIKPHVDNIPALVDDKSRVREAVVRNVIAQVRLMQANPVIAKKIKEGKIKVVGAYYEITSGAVDFIVL